MDARLPSTGSEAVTDRQREVARLIADGHTNPQIAEALGISLDGAKYHVSELLGRLGLARREEVAAWYREHYGWRTRLRGLFALPLLPLLLGGGAMTATVVAVMAVAVWGGGRGGGPDLTSFDLPIRSINLTYSTAIPLDNGRIFIAGGFFPQDDDEPGAVILDTRTGSTEVLDIASALQQRAVRLPDGRVALGAGFARPGPALLDHLVYVDPTTSEVSQDTFALAGTPSALAVSPSGRVVYVTQRTGLHVYSYIPGTQHSEDLGPLGFDSEDSGLSAHPLPDGRIAFVGATQVAIIDEIGVEKTIDLDGFAWQPAVVVMPDGRLVIIGGLDHDQWETYRFQARAYTDSLAPVRDSDGATPLAPPQFDVPTSAQVIVVDPDAGTARRAAALPEGRATASAFPMEDGRILIVGGIRRLEIPSEPPRNAPPSPLIFDPVTGVAVDADIPLPFIQGGVALGRDRFFLIGNAGLTADGRAVIWEPPAP